MIGSQPAKTDGGRDTLGRPGRVRLFGRVSLEWPGVIDGTMDDTRTLLVPEDSCPVEFDLGFGQERTLDRVVCGDVQWSRQPFDHQVLRLSVGTHLLYPQTFSVPFRMTSRTHRSGDLGV